MQVKFTITLGHIIVGHKSRFAFAPVASTVGLIDTGSIVAKVCVFSTFVNIYFS